MIWFVLFLGGVAVALFAFRVAEWHMDEAEYWAQVGVEVLWNPDVDPIYRPVMEWAKKNRPNVLRRAIRWESPMRRMAKESLQ